MAILGYTREAMRATSTAPAVKSGFLALAVLLAGSGRTARAQTTFVNAGAGGGAVTSSVDVGQGSRIVVPRVSQGITLSPPSAGGLGSTPPDIRRVGASARWIERIRAREERTLSRSRRSRNRLRSRQEPIGTAAFRRLAQMRARRVGNLITADGVIEKDAPGRLPSIGGEPPQERRSGIRSLAPPPEEPEPAPGSRAAAWKRITEKKPPVKRIATIGGH